MGRYSTGKEGMVVDQGAGWSHCIHTQEAESEQGISSQQQKRWGRL